MNIKFILPVIIMTLASQMIAQNVGINNNNPTEQLHIRTIDNKVALRLDNKKSVESGLNYGIVTGTPTLLQNAVFDPSWIDWTDLDHQKLVNSDNNRLSSPALAIFPERANPLHIKFDFSPTIPSTALITDINLHIEWRRTGTYAGNMSLAFTLLKASNLQPLIFLGYSIITSSTDINVTKNFKEIYNPLTPDMLNLNDVILTCLSLASGTNGTSALEIDQLWLEVEYATPADGTEDVSWTAGTKDGTFMIAHSEDLLSNQFLTIDENGITRVRGLRMTESAGSGKVLTSNEEGKASWEDLPLQDQLWLNKNDTAYFASGPAQINNAQGDAALIFDKGKSRLYNGINMIVTDNRILNTIIDANNDQANEQWNIYTDDAISQSSPPEIRWHLDGNDSWINGGGNLGIGKNDPVEKLDLNGAIRIGNTSNPTPSEGTIRWNDTNNNFEGYDGAQWIALNNSGFKNVSGIVQNSGNNATDDFVFGAIQLPGTGLTTQRSFFYDNNKGAFRVGKVDNSDNWAPDSIGFQSFSSGLNTKATGSSSTAMGRETTARGLYSTACGWQSTASGLGSLACGTNTMATAQNAIAFGHDSQSLGNYSFTAGHTSIANGVASTALGWFNTANGYYSAALGIFTTADARASTALGRYNVGGGTSDLWISTDPVFEIGIGTTSLERKNAMTVLKNGNTGILRDDPNYPLHVGTDATNGNGAHVTTGGTWSNGSSRLFKENFTTVNSHDILEKLASLNIAKWEYKGSKEGAHIGPIAEDFYAAFGLGNDEQYISTVDADGVAMAAIQALYHKLQEKEMEMESLKKQVNQLTAQIESFQVLKSEVNELKAALNK
jgi:hypothetical protein